MSDTIHIHQAKRGRGRKLLTAFLLLSALALCGAGCRALASPVRYPTAIDWQPYEAGFARAKAEGKPVMLLFGADWCEPCHVFADNVLSDPRVVAASKDFVMIHVNVDQREDIDRKYGLGGYKLPRTYFLTADGVILKAARRPTQCGRYDYREPISLIAGMEAALKLTRGSTPLSNDAPLPAQEAEVCAHEKGETTCLACLKQHCCAEMVACVNDRSCSCTTPSSGAAHVAGMACLKEHCAQADCPIPK